MQTPDFGLEVQERVKRQCDQRLQNLRPLLPGDREVSFQSLFGPTRRMDDDLAAELSFRLSTDGRPILNGNSPARSNISPQNQTSTILRRSPRTTPTRRSREDILRKKREIAEAKRARRGSRLGVSNVINDDSVLLPATPSSCSPDVPLFPISEQGTSAAKQDDDESELCTSPSTGEAVQPSDATPKSHR